MTHDAPPPQFTATGNSDLTAFGITGYTAASYGDAFADVYDAWYRDLDDGDFIDLIAQSLPAHPVRILELGVGTGRLVRALRERRKNIVDDIVGIDASAAMLEVARQHCDSAVTLVEGDFSTTLPDGPFDVIFVGYNTLFNVPNADALCSCLHLVAQRLSPTGTFFVDVVTAPQHTSGDHVGIRSMSATDVVLSISRHDADAQQITGQFVQFTEGQSLRLRPWSIRYFSPPQLDDYTERSGLHLQRRLADGHGTPFDVNAERHISVYGVTPRS